MLSRRHFLKAAAATSALARRGQAASRKPNVLMLMVDEHNPFYSSSYGDRYARSILTPNMDPLPHMGTVFENAYCPSPLCSPSRSAFTSGRWPHEIQVYSNCNVFRFDYRTLIGFTGQEPKTFATPAGNEITRLSVATAKRYQQDSE